MRNWQRSLSANNAVNRGRAPKLNQSRRKLSHAKFGWANSVDAGPDRASPGITIGTKARPSSPKSVDPAADLARCLLRLANRPSYPFDRLSRYEAILWRQAGQILFALDASDRRKPQKRAHGSVLVAGNTCRPTDTTTNELTDPLHLRDRRRARPRWTALRKMHCLIKSGSFRQTVWVRRLVTELVHGVSRRRG